jgi:hypothetical protein
MPPLVAASPVIFSGPLFLLMLVIFAASTAVFVFLNLRWTRDRQQAALGDWARDHEFKLHRAPNAPLPTALHSLGSFDTAVESSLTNGPLTIVRIVTGSRSPDTLRRWNVLIRETDHARTPAGLRPTGAHPSFLDLFNLTDFPAVLQSDRFLVSALDSKAAREIAKSPTRGLLPADIGLIVHGPYITLDFSSRPFDTIEFERMLAVMKQLTEHLPASHKS